MKKVFKVLICLMVIFLITGCGEKKESKVTKEKKEELDKVGKKVSMEHYLSCTNYFTPTAKEKERGIKSIMYFIDIHYNNTTDDKFYMDTNISINYDSIDSANNDIENLRNDDTYANFQYKTEEDVAEGDATTYLKNDNVYVNNNKTVSESAKILRDAGADCSNIK